jgi:polar amino acid transport system substrate-binding protein
MKNTSASKNCATGLGTCALARRLLNTCLAFLVLFAGVTFAAPADVAPTGVLRAAFLGSNPVQGQVNPQTGEVTGVVADLVREFARRLGVPYEIYPAANAADIVARLNTGKSDIGFIAFDAQRGKEVDFSNSYALMYNALVVRADAPMKTTADVDKQGLNVAAVRGQTQQIVLSASLKHAQMIILEKKPGQADIESLLSSKQIDAYGANRHDAETVAAASNGQLRALQDNFLVVEQAIVTSKNQPAKMAELNRFLEEARRAGFVQLALDRTRIRGLAVANSTNR